MSAAVAQRYRLDLAGKIHLKQSPTDAARSYTRDADDVPRDSCLVANPKAPSGFSLVSPPTIGAAARASRRIVAGAGHSPMASASAQPSSGVTSQHQQSGPNSQRPSPVDAVNSTAAPRSGGSNTGTPQYTSQQQQHPSLPTPTATPTQSPAPPPQQKVQTLDDLLGFGGGPSTTIAPSTATVSTALPASSGGNASAVPSPNAYFDPFAGPSVSQAMGTAMSAQHSAQQRPAAPQWGAAAVQTQPQTQSGPRQAMTIDDIFA